MHNPKSILWTIFNFTRVCRRHFCDCESSQPFYRFSCFIKWGGGYQVDVNANGLDSVVQLYSGTSAGAYNTLQAENPNNHVNENDDFGGSGSSRITGTPPSGTYVIRVSSFFFWVGSNSQTQTYTLSYTGFTNAAEPPQAIIYYEPILVPYLVSTSAPQIHFKDKKLICTSGKYRAGISSFGNIPTDGKDAYKPSNLTYNIFVNGQSQRTLTINSGENSASWALSKISSQGVATCSVAVTWNSLTIEDSSTGNISGLKSAKSRESEEVIRANTEYSALLTQNFEKYQKSLVDNRVAWREQVASIRANYYGSLARVTESNGAAKSITTKSMTLKEMIIAQRKSAADFRANQPIALASKDAANKAGLDAREAAIAKANATYGVFIESIGYGVLIP